MSAGLRAMDDGLLSVLEAYAVRLGQEVKHMGMEVHARQHGDQFKILINSDFIRDKLGKAGYVGLDDRPLEGFYKLNFYDTYDGGFGFFHEIDIGHSHAELKKGLLEILRENRDEDDLTIRHPDNNKYHSDMAEYAPIEMYFNDSIPYPKNPKDLLESRKMNVLEVLRYIFDYSLRNDIRKVDKAELVPYT